MTVLALYYFLADGHEPSASAMRLIPLDERYQRELVSKFVETSRAVTSRLAAGGDRSGIADRHWHLFCRTAGIVPPGDAHDLHFIYSYGRLGHCLGKLAVWIYFSGHVPTAILFAAWSAGVAVLCDNLLKSLVLHGQARLHPLLALLSVLGGVQMLGLLGFSSVRWSWRFCKPA